MEEKVDPEALRKILLELDMGLIVLLAAVRMLIPPDELNRFRKGVEEIIQSPDDSDIASIRANTTEEERLLLHKWITRLFQ